MQIRSMCGEIADLLFDVKPQEITSFVFAISSKPFILIFFLAYFKFHELFLNNLH